MVPPVHVHITRWGNMNMRHIDNGANRWNDGPMGIERLTVTFTLRGGTVAHDTLVHLDDAAGMDVEHVHAFISGVWHGATNVDARIESLDVYTLSNDGGTRHYTVARGTCGLPTVIDNGEFNTVGIWGE